MKLSSKFVGTLPVALAMFIFCSIGLSAPPVSHFLVTNNDNSRGNSATFYTVIHNGSLKQAAVVNTGGTGVDGIGSVATKRVSVLNNSTQACAFISDAGSADVAGISIATLTATGTFPAASTDSGPQGVGVVNNGTFLYASFTGSKTIATYEILSGCKLKFKRDITASGLNGSPVLDMAAHGSILVASFFDGSIGSFNIAHGVPISNHDLQFSTGNTQSGSFPAGVDITADGHFAIFGGTASPALVEVSDISSGKLEPTVVFSNLGTGSGSEAIWLSPDETLLYISNFSSSQVTATLFDATTGTVSNGCTSAPLKGNNFEAGLATAAQEGTGSTLYVAEPDVNIGVVNVTESSGSCSLEETQTSPVLDSNTLTIESIGSFPPRPF